MPLLLKEAQLLDFEEGKEGKDKPHVPSYEICKATAKLDSGKTHLVTIKVEVVKENLRMRSYYFHSVQ